MSFLSIKHIKSYMKYFFFTICFFVAVVFLFNYVGECNKPIQPKDTSTHEIRNTIDSIQKITIHDTIKELEIIYRSSVDTLQRWVYDSTWGYVLRIVGTDKPESGQREVVRRIFRGIYDSTALQVYRRQRQRDSNSIVLLRRLDTINMAKLQGCQLAAAETVKSKQKSRKRAKIGHIAGALIGLVLIIK